MINALLKGIIGLIIGLVQVVLYPIDLIIATALPGLDAAFTAIGTMFNMVVSVMGWVVSASGLSPNAISLIILYYGFALTVPLLIYSVKLALKWYNILKP